MAFLISEDMDDRVIHASIHGIVDRAGLNYYRDRLRDVSRTVTGISKKFIDRASAYLEDFDLDGIRDGLHALRDRWGKRWDVDRISDITGISDIQQAKSIMRRWIMANPRIRKLWREEKIYGFAGEFINSWDTSEYTDLSDYRKVMQGAYVGTDHEDLFITYLDVLEEVGDDVETLSFIERETIRAAWALAEEHLNNGLQDPTSPFKAML